MNIFYLNDDPKICAQEHIDKHVVKMITEHVQLLCTAYRQKRGQLINVSNNGKKQKRWVLPNHLEHILFKDVKQGAKLIDWILQAKENYLWLLEMTKYLNDEYKYRYQHKENHQSFNVLLQLPTFDDTFFSSIPRTPAISYMSEEYRICNDTLLNYQHYYRTAKKDFASWKKREIPTWFLIF